MLFGERGNYDLLPCAGITLIRFYGYDLSPPRRTPRETCPNKIGALKLVKLSIRKLKNFPVVSRLRQI